jgi:hypothetical protein
MVEKWAYFFREAGDLTMVPEVLAELRGELRGLQRGIEALCHVLRIELTDDRQRELATLDMAGLQALLARLETHAHWD